MVQTVNTANLDISIDKVKGKAVCPTVSCPALPCPSLPCQTTSVQTSFMGTETFNIYLIHCPKVSNCHLYFLLLLAQQNVPTSFVYQAEINSCYVQLQTMGDWNLTANIFLFFLLWLSELSTRAFNFPLTFQPATLLTFQHNFGEKHFRYY